MKIMEAYPEALVVTVKAPYLLTRPVLMATSLGILEAVYSGKSILAIA
jgi:hypothetical protein